MSNIIPFDGNKLPSFLKNRAALAASELTANVGNGGFPVMSIKGKTFTMVRSGERETLMNPNDQDEIATSINVVILKANPNLSKVWYAKQFVEGSDAKPDCFSNDGIAPDPGVEKPQAKKCSVCPKNEWGSRVTEDGKKGKACADSRRLAIANVDAIDEPILLRAPAATLKPLAEYGAELAKRGVPYNAVLTKIGFDREAASPKLTFKAVGFLTEDQYEQVGKAVDDETVASILGKPGESPTPEAGDDAPAAPKIEAKPKAEPKPAKAEPKASADEVAEAVESPKAEAKPAAKKEVAKPKPEPKVAADDDLEAELDNLLGELDD
jgi:hypothetical protein